MVTSRFFMACRSRDSSASSRKRTLPLRSIRGLSTRRTGFSSSSPAFTTGLSTLESVKRSRSTVVPLRPSFRRRAFHASMRSTAIAERGSAYQVLNSRCNFSSVLAAVRGRLAFTHFVYVSAMNIPSEMPSVPPTPCNGWRPCATFPRTFCHRSRASSGATLPTVPRTTRRLRPKRA
jgi:hypothetical protein